jgi:hypothetical protein
VLLKLLAGQIDVVPKKFIHTVEPGKVVQITFDNSAGSMVCFTFCSALHNAHSHYRPITIPCICTVYVLIHFYTMHIRLTSLVQHFFYVIRSAGQKDYNFINPPHRDVVNTGGKGDQVTIRFVKDNVSRIQTQSPQRTNS